MTDSRNNRLTRTFADFRADGRKALLPFVTAGFPDLDTTEAILHELRGRGIRICELGIPFSDPIADGPVIQASYTEALAAGVSSERIFDMVRRYRAAEGQSPAATPPTDRRAGKRRPVEEPAANPESEARNPQLALAAMVSYSIVYRHGVREYLREAAEAGFDATIVPDLPLEEAPQYEELAASQGLCNVMLVAPTSDPSRRLAIARHSRGFIYYVSVAGITGERDRLPQATLEAVAELRRHTDTPICVGFGISRAATVAEVCKVADGAIVGSAIVHRIADAAKAGAPRAQLVRQVGQFVAELLAPLR